MKNKLNGFGFLKSLFTKLILSFILIIFIILSAQFFTYNKYFDSLEKETIKNADERLDNLVNKFEQYFNGIHSALVKASIDEAFNLVSNGDNISNYDEKLISDMFMSYTQHNQYIKNLVLINKKSRFIVTQEGTFNKQGFFKNFYYNDSYSEAFWEKEMEKDFIYNYYPTGEFVNSANISKTNKSQLLPVVIKRMGNSSYLLIAFIDVKSLAESIESTFVKNLYIFKSNTELVYPQDIDLDGLNLPIPEASDFERVNNMFIFYRKKGGLSYYKIIPYNQIIHQLNQTKLLYIVIISLSLAVSLVISLYLARKFSSPVKQISDIMRKFHLEGHPGNIVDLKLIRDRVQEIVLKNNDYINDINSKDAVIKKFSYYARIINLNIGLTELVDSAVSLKNYILIYFKVHFKEEFFKAISKEKSKGSLLIKELIQLYLKEFFTNTVTCLPENDRIISIIEVDINPQDIRMAIKNILQKLDNESEFLFFTIAVSNVCDNMSELNSIYTRVFEIVKYRQLSEATQVLYEDSLSDRNDKLFFNIDQADQFAHSLYNSKCDECISLMKSILGYNVRKGVSEFYINLIAIELINCCVKVLTEIYLEIPGKFNTSDVYGQLEQCSTLLEYEELLGSFIKSVSDFLNENKKESDYIIDFCRNYAKQHFMEDITLELMADKLNITKNYLSAYFKSKTGVNLSDYINNYRIKKSIEILGDSSVKIHEAGARVGLPNSNTFIRLFRKFTGMAPGEYRKAMFEQAAAQKFHI
jgi:AraC-like DNA-binding protein